ncbi:MAG TPA: oligosaccharide flippase family protein [Verrucomicrobiae bacterium]|nr:oligosaccharide flippase family protein [Verrucomicrobiae bacterium]
MSRYAFFRQTGWMLMATGFAGAFVLLVPPILTKPLDFLPFLRPKITGAEFGLFQTLMALVSWLNIPSNGVQSTLAHQTASAVTPELQRQLNGTVRKLLLGLTGIWLLAVSLTLVFQNVLMRDFKVYHPASLWVTMLIGLPVLWQPVLSGILQGRENFMWLGWQSILNSIARVVAIFVFVRLMGVHVTGAMAGVFAGSCTSLAISFWQSRSLLRGPAAPVDWSAWLRRLIPLTLGLGAAAFMVSADLVFVRRYFAEEQSGLYSAVAVIGRALMFLIVPMTQVMFPKVVQAAAKLERTDVMAQALAATGLIGAAAAAGCTLFPELPIRVLFPPEVLTAKSLVAVYAWCMIPMTLSNVLVNNLMARQHYHSVPWLVAVAAAYGGALVMVATRMNTSASLEAFRAIVLTFGLFSVLMLAITVWFTIRKR